MSKFNSKSFKFTQADLNNCEIDLTGYITEGDKVAENIATKSKKTHLGINFDSEEYINDMELDNYLGNLEQYINDDEAPIDFKIEFPIFFIPFVARFRVEYGFEIGIEISTQNHFLSTDFYGEAHASASASAGIELGMVEFGGGLRGLFGYGRVGMKPFIDLKYFITKIEFYVKLATLKFQVFAYLILVLPRIKYIKIRFLYITIRIPIIMLIPTRFEIGSKWKKGLQKYISTTKELL